MSKRTPESRAAHAAARKAHLEDIKARKAASKARAASGRRWKHWTTDEDRLLTWAWGNMGGAAIAAQIGRTHAAIISRAFTLRLPAPAQGTLTLNDLIRQTGYSHNTIKRAMVALGIQKQLLPLTWVRSSKSNPRRRWAMAEQEADAICAWLRANPGTAGAPRVSGAWGIGGYPAACVHCGRSDSRRNTKDTCVRCYHRLRVPPLSSVDDRTPRAPKSWGAPGCPSECIVCSTAQRPYYAKNMCSPCYERARRRTAKPAAPPQAEPQRRAA